MAQEKVGEAAEVVAEGLLGTLDYLLLAAIAGAAAWWFLIREGESDQIPEYEIKPMAVPVGTEAGSGGEKGFLAKMKKTKRRMVVFYGSQTGTAEEFAGRLAKEGARCGLEEKHLNLMFHLHLNLNLHLHLHQIRVEGAGGGPRGGGYG